MEEQKKERLSALQECVHFNQGDQTNERVKKTLTFKQFIGLHIDCAHPKEGGKTRNGYAAVTLCITTLSKEVNTSSIMIDVVKGSHDVLMRYRALAQVQPINFGG